MTVMVTEKEDKDFVCVHFPGYVKDVKNVIQALGGEKKLAKCADSETEMPYLRYHQHDPNTIPLRATKNPIFGVVLRVRKNRSSGEVRINVVGTVVKSYKFSNPFDFQLPTPAPLRALIDRDPLCQCIPEASLQVHFIPTKLSIIDTPTEFSLSRRLRSEELFDFDVTETALMNTSDLLETYSAVNHMHFNDKQVPNRNVDPDTLPQSLSPCHHHLWKSVLELIKERKLCTKLYVECKLGLAKEVVSVVLRHACFYWIDGPWAKCWNIFGFDPRKNPEAAPLQTLDLRFYRRLKPNTSDFDKSLGGAKSQKRQNYALTDEDPTKSGIYQLIDIQFDEVQNMIKHYSKSLKPACDVEDGWFSKGFYKKLRCILNKNSEA